MPSQVFRGFEQLSSSISRRFIPGMKCTPEWLLREQNSGQFLVYEP